MAKLKKINKTYFFSVLILFLAINLILILYLNGKFKKNFVNLENNNIGAYNNTSVYKETLNSFGDHFSSLVYIDKEKTTMKWDENVTAFTFPPLYSFEKIKLDANSSATNSIDNFVEPKEIGLNFKMSNNKLYYHGQKINLPSELKTENILDINISLIGDRYLVGVVTGYDYDKRGWVYFFDPASLNFLPLITSTTTEKIEPKYERLGGTISFGGTTDNFLIVYGGYDGHIFYYYKGTLSDVSRFFGLRVSAGGFKPKIISRTNSRGPLFYICSETEGKAKFIKLWSEHPGELAGSLDLSPLIFTGNLNATSVFCENKKDGNNNILMNIKKPDGTSEIWRFVDRGFDNSRDREVVSLDLGQGRGQKITRVIISDLNIFNTGMSLENILNSRAKIFFANSFVPKNNLIDWQAGKPYTWFEFNFPTESLFWRMTFQAESDSADYSPWFDHINQLNYLTI